MADLDMIKDIPGYKAILKFVIKSQIQLLIGQLSDSIGEESVILTANLNDGHLSHLGSDTGKVFLEGRDELKSQFLGFCLKRHHYKKESPPRPTPYQRPDASKRMGPASKIHSSPSKYTSILPTTVIETQIQTQTSKRPSATDSILPVGLTTLSSDTPPLENMSGMATSGITLGISAIDPDINKNNSNGSKTSAPKKDKIVKLEMSQHQNHDNSNSEISNFSTAVPELELSLAQTSDNGIIAITVNRDEDSDTDTNDMTPGKVGVSVGGALSDPDNEDSTGATSIKIEPITENEMELEITGIEPVTRGHSVTHVQSVTSDTWGQGQMVYRTPETEGDGEAYDQSADASRYSPDGDHSTDAAYGYGTTWIPDEQTDTFITSGRWKQTTKQPMVLDQDTLHQMASEAVAKGKKSQCGICMKWFYKKTDLIRHQRSHTGEKPFQCKLCFKSFTRKSTVKLHMAARHRLELW